MKVKYVEAMITSSGINKPEPEMKKEPDFDMDRLDAAIDRVLEADIGSLSDAFVKLQEAADALGTRLNGHDCADYVSVPAIPEENPLVPLSSADSILTQMSQLLFLPGDEVAILRLSDLKALLANQKEAAA